MSTLRERKKEALKNEILKAAEQTFLLQGYEKTTMAQIAEKANAGVGTAYNYFSSKAELYIGVFVQNAHLIIEERIEKIINEAGNDPEITFLLILEVYFDVLQTIDKDLFKEFIRVIVSNPEECSKNMQNHIDLDLKAIEQLYRVFSLYREKGKLAADFNVKDGAECFYGIVVTQCLLYYLYEFVPDLNTVKENTYRQIKTFIMQKFVV